MIKRDELKDWLKESERRASISKIETYLDNQIKNHVLKGKYSFTISTGEPDNVLHRDVKTGFYDIWHDPDLSKDNRRIVHSKILEKYRTFGFKIDKHTVDCGWNSRYDAVSFKDIDKSIEEEVTE
ncbi:hypothetical protein [Paenilisteria rocourtiae]|uniref:Uncharacterized protein n=1 Tax=Listeria rocourtiae TaxID=647910 RepID=A0A4R6ZRE1_9LIST|nr:hypothetical protein [Listeria rocourtiae]EUJ44438.1 hypothetical protein PROCOU_14083 [Listeria rocourtiae FSL F6-920]TDR55078.1 hypothetical protein DFP96_1014 [Listeria rocourtiae]